MGCINFSRKRHLEDPFILASQAQQCFYIQEPIEPIWHIAIRKPPRDLFDMPGLEANEVFQNCCIILVTMMKTFLGLGMILLEPQSLLFVMKS